MLLQFVPSFVVVAVVVVVVGLGGIRLLNFQNWDHFLGIFFFFFFLV